MIWKNRQKIRQNMRGVCYKFTVQDGLDFSRATSSH